MAVRSQEEVATKKPGRPAFSRVLLKLSGEAFSDTSTGYGIDAAVVSRIAEEVTEARGDRARE